jgi:hypothetical protein
MNARPRPTLARWIGLAALAFLAVGVGVAWRQWSPRTTVSTAAVPDSTAEGAIDEALAQAGPDEKSRWVDEVPEVDVSGLDDRQRTFFLQVVNARRCTCGCGYTLAACRVYDAACDKSLPRVEAVLDSVRRGLLAQATDAQAAGGGR